MFALKFPSKITGDKKITIPDEYNSVLLPDQEVQIIVLYEKNETSSDKNWDNMTVKEFFNGYSDRDSVYDKI